MGLHKYDHPPLLAPGRHYCTIPQIEAWCVYPFEGQDRVRREILFYALEDFIQRILISKIRCDAFIDGSFMTKKPQPDDVDVVVSTELCVFEKLSEDQMQLLEEINKPGFVTGVDSIALTTYPRGHSHFGAALDLGNAGELYGLEHGKVWLKGYAVIRLWETDVGNRICR